MTRITMFNELINTHEGARVCVMGGAACLDDDLKQINADLFISANEHGCKIRKADYIVAMDEQHGCGRAMGKVLREFSDAPIISPASYSDYKMSTWPFAPRRIYSGLVGAWVAWALGAKVVILAGMDSYNGTVGAVNKAKKYHAEIPCPVRSVGGRMGDVWPAYRKGERFRVKHYPAMDTLIMKDGMTTVRAMKPTSVNGIDLDKGDTLEVMRHDARRLLRHNILVEI